MRVKFVFAFGFLCLFAILFLGHFVLTGNALKESGSNLEVELPSDYRQVLPGTEIWFTTKLMNLASVGRRDVVLKYDVLDMNDGLVLTKSETVAVETQASFVNSFILPEDIFPGNYILKVSLLSTEQEQLTGTEVSFSVYVEEGFSGLVLGELILGGIFVLVFILFIIFRGKIFLRHLKIRFKIKRIVRKKLSNWKD